MGGDDSAQKHTLQMRERKRAEARGGESKIKVVEWGGGVVVK